MNYSLNAIGISLDAPNPLHRSHEVGVELPIGRKHADAMQFEPLVGEGLEKTADLAVGDHPGHL